MDKIVCPICKDEFTSLGYHLKYVHHMTCDEFRKRYPGSKIQLDNRKRVPMKCPYCDRIYNLKNCLQVHIKQQHPEHFSKIESNDIKGHFVCKICEKRTNQLKNHVICSHPDVLWEQYCETYNHDVKNCTFFSEEHKKTLSKNKSKFYKTENGKKWLDDLSKRMSGSKNPACRLEIRRKISEYASKRMILGIDGFSSRPAFRGIHFSFEYDGVRYHTRSFEEFRCIYTLLKRGVSFEYESTQINYVKDGLSHYYIPDLIIGNRIIELKSDPEKRIGKHYSDERYSKVAQLIKPPRTFEILNYSMLCRSLNIDEYSMKEIYSFVKDLLDNDKCKISWSMWSLKANSIILRAIDENYMENKNIHMHKENA